MCMKQLITTILVCLITTHSIAQYQGPVSSRISSGLDVGVGFRTNQVSPSLSYYQLLNVTKSKWFSIGWTASFRTNYASDVDYVTAPAELSRGKTGIYALGAPYKLNQIDTLRMASASGTSFNFGIRAQFRYRFLEIGASADLLGLTLGRRRVGRYLSQNGYYYRGQTATGADSLMTPFRGAYVDQSAKPSGVNLQLLGDNSYGTLATEIFARAHINQRIAVKVGYQWLSTEYTTSVTNKLDGNNRFRNTAGLTYLAVTFPAFY